MEGLGDPELLPILRHWTSRHKIPIWMHPAGAGRLSREAKFGRCGVHELPDGIGDAPPDRRTVVIAQVSKLIGSPNAYHFRLIA
jgi:hypothetical protein